MASKMQELSDIALAAVPTTGAIKYGDLVDKLTKEGNVKAVPLIAELKKRGVLRSRLVYNDDGSISHFYERVVR